VKKAPKYTVEKVKSDSIIFEATGGYYWTIWFELADIVFYTKDAANKACEAFNMYDGIRNLQRKVRNLQGALDYFNEE
jgi:hypothetical protein